MRQSCVCRQPTYVAEERPRKIICWTLKNSAQNLDVSVPSLRAHRSDDTAETPGEAEHSVSSRSIRVVCGSAKYHATLPTRDISDGASELPVSRVGRRRRLTTPTAPPKMPWTSRTHIASDS